MTFKDFDFDPAVLEAIDAMRYEKPTPVQEQAIPAILKGSDLIVSAQTGTGKTAAFLLPVISKLQQVHGEREGIRAFVVVPTRELAVQIDQQMEGFSYFTDVSSIPVYGGGDGKDYVREKNSLKRGADIIICTPGKIISHLNMGYVNTQFVEYLILDEADRMLDIGFYDDIMRIVNALPKKRQTLMFSATMPPKIRQLAKKVLHNPLEINLDISKPPEKIRQSAYVVFGHQKSDLLVDILTEKDLRSVIVFCSTKSSTKDLRRQLARKNLSVKDIHSDLEQTEREEVLRDFKNRKINILVATDILSRGIDIEDIDMVVNYDVPHDGEDYVHRVGRTARAESDGVALTFISEKEQHKFGRIEDLLGHEVKKETVPEKYGDTPDYNPKPEHKRRSNKRYSKKKGGGRQGHSHKSKNTQNSQKKTD